MQDHYPSMYQEMKPQLPDQEHLKCPRCGSLNTKFCYYNNYNLSQPRHFCKSCRRYWTKGGTLRNIPVGGATRKTTNTKRSSNPRRSSATALAIRKPEPNGTFALLASKVSQDPGISPSFRSLLTPNGQFGNLIYGPSSNGSTAKVGEFAGYSNSGSQSSLIRYPFMKFQSSDNGETLLGGRSGGNSSCCGGGNEYLAIFTPGSSYPELK